MNNIVFSFLKQADLEGKFQTVLFALVEHCFDKKLLLPRHPKIDDKAPSSLIGLMKFFYVLPNLDHSVIFSTGYQTKEKARISNFGRGEMKGL